MNATPESVARDPDWLPYSFDASGARLEFVHFPRARHAGVTFLSGEHFPPDLTRAAFGFPEIEAAAATIAPAPCHFIFHSAFCCSTLLVTALDVEGAAVGLKEPSVLLNLANRLQRADDDANRRRLDLGLRLLARPFSPGERVIVKPTNFANRLIAPMLTMRSDARAILLWSDLASFLGSVAKKGMFGRIWARQLYLQLLPWAALETGFSPEDVFKQTDLQIAAMGWLMQIALFDRLARQFGASRLRTVSDAEFLADKQATLAAAAGLFGLDLGPERIAAIASGPVFAKHSKFLGAEFDGEARAAELSAAGEAHGEEIAMVVTWAEAVAAHCRLPTALARTLF